MPVLTYNCGVLGCGGGACVHRLLDETCPHCGSRMVEVMTTGFKFCSNTPTPYGGCEYEVEACDERGSEMS